MNVYIDSVRLVGCQGYRDVTLEFSSGLNILKADNNSVGKSIFFKMLREVITPGYWGREGVKQLIRWGSSCAKMLFKFSDQTECLFRLFPTYRQYVFKDNQSGVECVSEQPPEELLRRLSAISSGMYTANMLTTQGDLLFVESSSATNRALLTLLTSHEKMETLIEGTKEAIKGTEEKKRQLSVVQQYLTTEFRGIDYQDTVDLKDKKDTLDLVIPTLELLEGFVEALALESEVERFKRILNDVEGVIHLAHALSLIVDVASSMEGLEDKEWFGLLSDGLLLLDALRQIPVVDVNLTRDLAESKAVLEGLCPLKDSLSGIVQCFEEIERLRLKEQEVKETLDSIGRKGHCAFHGGEVYFSEKGCIPCGK